MEAPFCRGTVDPHDLADWAWWSNRQDGPVAARAADRAFEQVARAFALPTCRYHHSRCATGRGDIYYYLNRSSR